MKTKNLIIIFILFLLIMLASGLVVFFTGENEQPVLSGQMEITNYSNQPVAEKKQGEVIKDKPVSETAGEIKPIVQPEKTVLPEAGHGRAEQIQAVMLINGIEYRTAVKPASSVYDLMSALKEQKKIDFKGKNYPELGFFVEEINGIKNNPSGANWLYYVNGQPAQVGISNYKLKNNDTIEWKYEDKPF